MTHLEGSIIVELDWPVVDLAGMVAWQRLLFNLMRGVREKYGAGSELGGFDKHFAGCLGEIALAKHLGVFWDGSIGHFKAPDVGGFQVRAATRGNYRLMLHPYQADTDAGDKDDDIFVLAHTVASCLPRVRLCGWIRGRDGKRDEFWQDPGTDRPAFFVPTKILQPVESLPAVTLSHLC